MICNYNLTNTRKPSSLVYTALEPIQLEKLINAQAITSLLHHRGLLVFQYHREIYLILKGNKKKVWNFVFFFLWSNNIDVRCMGPGCSIERMQLTDRYYKDIRLQPLCENT